MNIQVGFVMYDPKGRLLSEEPAESLRRTRTYSVVAGVLVLLLTPVAFVLSKDAINGTIAAVFILFAGGYFISWSRIATPLRVYEGGIELFSGFGARFVPWSEMGEYYERGGLNVYYYPPIRTGGTNSRSYRIHVPDTMPDYLRVAPYIKRMVDENSRAQGTKVYVGAGPFRYRAR